LPTGDIKLYNSNNNCNNNWYLYWYEIVDGKKKRRKLYGGINRGLTAKDRYDNALELLKKIAPHAKQDLIPKNKRKTVGQSWEEYVASKARVWKNDTLATHVSKYKRFLAYAKKRGIDARSDVTLIDASVAKGFMDSLICANITCNDYLYVMRAWLPKPFNGISIYIGAKKKNKTVLVF